MSMQQQKQKDKQTYDEILEELKSIGKKMATVFVPKLCLALKDEHPDWDNPKLKSRVLNDISKIGWNEQYIERVIRVHAGWLNEDNPNHENTMKMWRARRKNEIDRLNQRLSLVAKDPLPEPPEPKEKPIMTDEKWQDTGLASYGGRRASRYEITQNIHEGARLCFEALCDGKFIPTDGTEDILVDYIKPTREFRDGIALEMNKGDRATMHNAMHAIVEAAEDMIRAIDKADKK